MVMLYKKLFGDECMKNSKHILIFILIAVVLLAAVIDWTRKANGDSSNQESAQNQQDAGLSQIEQKQASYLDPALSTEEKVAILLSEMTLEEKAGQMVQASMRVVTGDQMANLSIGSVLSGGGDFPGQNKVEDWTEMIEGLQTAAMQSPHQIPMMYGLDAVHGIGLVKDAVVFPHNIGLGAANDPELMYKMGAAVAEEMKLLGVLWNFSPCIAVNADPRWGRTYECFSSDPAIVTALADAYIKGLMDHGVMPTLKHYVADGGAVFGTGEGNFLIDRGEAQMSEEDLRKVHLAPYEALIKSGAKTVMASHGSYVKVKMHKNEYLITNVLKGELGFSGFVISDWESINNLDGDSLQENVVMALKAGIDMFMEPFNYVAVRQAIINSVNDGLIPQERIDDAVTRILTVKFEMGLFDDPYQEKITHEVTSLGSEEYRALAKELVEKSLVLLKNDNNTLPLKQGQKIFVTGPAINDIGMQCGGWGLSWQGYMDGGNGKVTSGTTILEGLQAYAEEYGLEIITDENEAKNADVVIMAIGEMPYAEYEGDTDKMTLTDKPAHFDNEKTIEFVDSLDKPTVTLIIAGRNVLITEYLDKWDSIVMCYLPGTEGDGIASVLVGEKPFTGKLAMPYYKEYDDIAKEDVELLFDVGYGLTY